MSARERQLEQSLSRLVDEVTELSFGFALGNMPAWEHAKWLLQQPRPAMTPPRPAEEGEQ